MRAHHPKRGDAPKHTPEQKAKFSTWKREWDKTHPGGMLGKHHSLETRIKMSIARQGFDNPNWKGGNVNIAKRIRQCQKSMKLIDFILKRDNYTCQLCGSQDNPEVDHIKPFSEIFAGFLKKYTVLNTQAFAFELCMVALKYKPFWDKTNLRVLCLKCNRSRKLCNGTD